MAKSAPIKPTKKISASLSKGEGSFPKSTAGSKPKAGDKLKGKAYRK